MADSKLTFDIIAKDRASGDFARVAMNARLLNSSLDDINSNALGLTKMALAPSLIPTLAVAGASTMSLVTALGAAAGAGGIFGAAVIGTVTEMKKQQKIISASDKKLSTLTAGTKAYADQQKHLKEQQAAFNKQFGPAAKGIDNMKSAWHAFLGGTQKTTNSVIGHATNLVAKILPKMVPVANAAGRAINGLIKDLGKWAKSPGFNKLLNFFATSGAKNITKFGHIVGNLFVGLGGIFKNFVGSGDKAASSLETLTARFAKWGNSKGVSTSVQKFLDYAHDNGPKVSKVLGSIAAILPKVATSFAGIGSITLTGASGFLDIIAKLPPSVFHALATGLFAIGAAVKIVRLGVAAWAAAQWLLNAAMDANPIGLVIGAIALLAAGLVYAYKHSATFRKIVQDTFAAVGRAGSFMWNNVLKPVFSFLIKAWMNVAGWIVNGAAKAFGWVPGIGPKLRAAAGYFNTFKDHVNNQLDGVHKNIKVTADTTAARHSISGFVTFYNQQMSRLPKNTHAGTAGSGPGVLLNQGLSRSMTGGAHITQNFHGPTDAKAAGREAHKALLAHRRAMGGGGLGLG